MKTPSRVASLLPARVPVWVTAWLLASLPLAGCAVGPDYHPPAPPPADALGPLAGPGAIVPPGGKDGPSQRLIPGQDIPAQWWALYHSPALNRLITEALAHNADVAAAQAALKAAYEVSWANAGGFLPSVTGDFSASRQKDASGTVQPTAADNSPQLTLYTPQLSIAYSPDLWGGLRRAQESLDAQAQAQRFQTEATYLTLTANVVVAAVTEAGLRAQIEATEALIAEQRHLLDILSHQRDLGQASGADVAAQVTALAQAEQALPPLRKALDQARHQLNALLGRLPGDPTPETFTLADFTLPADLPVSLPAQLVEHRPDIRMAAADLHAASAQVGVAVADRLPNLQLVGSTGSTASSLGSLFTPGTGFWTIGSDLSLPLFDGFALAHKEKAARAQLEQAAAQYRGTVLTAFQNVADSLTALRADTDAWHAAIRAEAAAARGLAIARRQLALGAIASSAVITAEQAWQQARLALAQTHAALLTDTAALFQALGGGWWNVDNGKAVTPGHAQPDAGGLVTD